MAPNPIDLRQLARQHERLGRMVRALVGDEHRAEDVVQDAWVRALESGPKEPGALGAWLSKVTRRLAFNDRRGQRRRDHHERTGARAEALPSSAEIAERVEIEARVLAALEGLDEPHRTTMRDRYMGDLTPAEIARRDGDSLNTVKSRLSRARAAMRERLDREGLGGDVHWSVVVAPLLVSHRPWVTPNDSGAVQASASPSTSAIAPSAASASTAVTSLAGISALGGTLVMKKALVFAAALLVGVVAWQLVTLPEAESLQPAIPTPSTAVAQVELEPLDDGVLESPEGGARVAADKLADAGSAGLAGTVKSWRIEGRARETRANEGIVGVAFDLAIHAGYAVQGAPLLEVQLVSADDGRFELALEDPGQTVTITVDSKDTAERAVVTYGPYVVVAGDAPPQLDALVFPIDGRIAGTVRDPAGSPVAGCTVEGLYGRTESAADGSYEMRIASSAWGAITATAAGFGADSRDLEGLAPGGTTTVDFTLSEAIRIEGVVRAASGAAIAGARVEGSGAVWSRTETDLAGRFVLDSIAYIPGESVWMSVRAEGFGTETASLDIEVDSREYEQDFELVHGVLVAGRVVAPDDTPVAGAEVWIGSQRLSWDSSTTLSDDDGRFSFASVPPGRMQTGASKAGFAPATSMVTVLEHGGTEELLLRFPVARTVRGVVLDETGTPLSGVSIAARQNYDYVGGRGQSDANGNFEVTDLPDGALSIEAFARGLVRTHARVAAGAGSVVIEMVRAGRIAGRALDAATGAPLTSFTVRFVYLQDLEARPLVEGYDANWSQPGRTFLDEDGRWSTGDYDELASGAWVGVEVRASGYAPAVLPVQVLAADAESDLVHELVRPITLELSLALEGSGVPVAGATVEATTLAYVSEEDLRWNATTDEAGSAEFDGVSPGPLYVTVTRPGGAALRLGPFEVPASPSRSVLAIEVPAGRTVEITLLDAAGDPLPHRTVLLSATIEGSGSMSHKGNTDTGGVFRVDGVLPGRWQVSRVLQDGPYSCHDLTGHLEVTESDEVARLELRPPGATILRGTVLADGPLVPGCRVSALSRDGAPNHGALVSEGRFELHGLAPGSYLVSLSYWDSVASTLLSGHAELAVQEGDLELQLELTVQAQEH